MPEDRENNNKEPRSDNTQGDKKPRSDSTLNDPISTISDIHELRSEDKKSTPQRMTSVAGYPKNRLYIDSGTSLHILLNKERLGGLHDTTNPRKIQAGSKPFHTKQIGSLHQALQHLPLPVTIYHYRETTIANLLSFARLVDEYYIICNTRVNHMIYVQSKDNSKYLQFQRDYKCNLYYMGISEADLDEHWYLNTMKKGKTTFSVLDQK